MCSLMTMVFVSALVSDVPRSEQPLPTLCRSVASGRWSQPATWERKQVPGSGARVQVRAGHVVTFDITTDAPIRSIHVAGTLRFDPERDTRLDVGLIKVLDGNDASESGFASDHAPAPAHGRPMQAPLPCCLAASGRSAKMRRDFPRCQTATAE